MLLRAIVSASHSTVVEYEGVPTDDDGKPQLIHMSVYKQLSMSCVEIKGTMWAACAIDTV